MEILYFQAPESVPGDSLIVTIFKIIFSRKCCMIPITTDNYLPNQLSFIENIYLPRVRQWIQILWNIKILVQTIHIEMQLNINSQNHFAQLPRKMKEHEEQVVQFISLINLMYLSNEAGVLLFNKKNGNLKLKVRVEKISLISSPRKLEKYIQKKIANFSSLFIEHIENIIFYFGIVGCNLRDCELAFQRYNQVPLQYYAKTISLLKEMFQIDRLNRSKRTRIDMKAPGFPSLDNILKFISISERQQNQDQQKGKLIKLVHEQYKKQRDDLINNLVQFQQNSFNPILTSIDIRNRTEQKILNRGGYALITKGIYSYIPQISIFQNGEVSANNKVSESLKLKTGCSLVKKVGLDKTKVHIAIQNECDFLTFIRNKVCPYFAKYFCNKAIIPFSNKEIYLQYYPLSLKNSTLKEEQMLKVMEDVCMGLLFMSQQNIVHRDLKQQNVMIDHCRRGKIIDFGSVSPVYGTTQFRPRDNILRSTKNYYVPYNEVIETAPSLSNKISKLQYYTHRTFDLYSFGIILQKSFGLDYVVSENHFVRYHIKFLSLKCMELNPQDRWSHDQVVIFIRHLLIFLQARKQFWGWGFDSTSLVHQLNSSMTSQQPLQYQPMERTSM